jgi:hypothetical protein
LNNEHEIIEIVRKLRELKSKGHIFDCLVKLKDLNLKVGSAAQVFHSQVTSQMQGEIVDMIYTNEPIYIENHEFFRLLELAGKTVEEKIRNSKSGDKAAKKEENHKDKK